MTKLQKVHCSMPDKSATGNLYLTEKTMEDQWQESTSEQQVVLQDTAWSGDEILAEAQVWVRRLACICFAIIIVAEVITGKVQDTAPFCLAIGKEARHDWSRVHAGLCARQGALSQASSSEAMLELDLHCKI